MNKILALGLTLELTSFIFAVIGLGLLSIICGICALSCIVFVIIIWWITFITRIITRVVKDEWFK